MKILIGIQARSHSTRLPGKIYEKIGPKALLQWVYDAANEATRILRAKHISAEAKILGHAADTDLRKYCLENSVPADFPKVKEDDLILRYLEAAKEYTHIIRLTADCWQSNPALIAELAMMLKDCDYSSNTIHRTFYEGLDMQGCSYRALQWFEENQLERREHPFIEFDENQMIRDRFLKRYHYMELLNPQNIATIRTSIDNKEDLEAARSIYDKSEKAKQRMVGTK